MAGPVAYAVADGPPDAIVDLATDEGVRLVRGQWRYQDARIVEVDFRAPGPDLRPSGARVRTHDVTPAGGAAGFDDSGWEPIEPASLEARRTRGRLAFGWYRIRITIPDRVGDLDPTGATVVFEIVVDDYAEVWVDGRLSRRLGQRGGTLVAGFNAPNRVVVGRDVRPGQQIQLAVFAANGPLSEPPANFVWVRSATLDFHARGRAAAAPVAGRVVRHDPALDAVVRPGAIVERVAEGFRVLAGPVWTPDGALLVSDPAANAIYSWTPDGELAVFRTKSGYAGADVARYRRPGANGLALDPEGRLTIAEHGNRRVTRLEKNGVLTVLADRHQGRRLNSPSDLVYRSDGTLYFTDPPFGLPGQHGDAARELPVSGVFRLRDGVLALVATDLDGPDGLALSPDERFLYVGNRAPRRKVVMRYPVAPDGDLGPGQVFLDVTGAPGEEAPEGLEVDRAGHLYVAGPGGVWIVSPDGRHLGTIELPEAPSNLAWGEADGRTLYVTARTGLYRIRPRDREPGAAGPQRDRPCASSANRRAGVTGTSVISAPRSPSASATALAIAAAPGIAPLSPTPLTPSSFTADRCSSRATDRGGRSSARGIA
jgi:gluconolactonase